VAGIDIQFFLTTKREEENIIISIFETLCVFEPIRVAMARKNFLESSYRYIPALEFLTLISFLLKFLSKFSKG
jgi:hypothetical protein